MVFDKCNFKKGKRRKIIGKEEKNRHKEKPNENPKRVKRICDNDVKIKPGIRKEENRHTVEPHNEYFLLRVFHIRSK